MLAEINLIDSWSNTIQRGYYNDSWLDQLRETVDDPESVDDIRFCADCGQPGLVGNMRDVGRGMDNPDCEDCVARYYRECIHCNRLSNHTTTINGDDAERVCSDCLNEFYFFCRTCNTWCSNDDEGEHQHPTVECCESPEKEFTFPNQGVRLTPDTRVVVAINDEVNNTGLSLIRETIIDYAVHTGDIGVHETRANRLWRFASRFDVGRERTTSAGTFPTRIKRQAYKEWKLKIDPGVLTEIGNIVSAHSRGLSRRVAVTRDLNQPARAFAHPGSCWWTDYKTSRCCLKTNGGLALRSFHDNGRVSGRVWVLPLRQEVDGHLGPTFRTDGNLWLVFNGYGELNELVGVRVVAKMTGIESYQLIEAQLHGMYVNNSTAYLIGKQDALARYNSMRIALVEHSNLYDQEKEMAHV